MDYRRKGGYLEATRRISVANTCHKPNKVLVLYTGGTIGMVRNKDNVLAPAKGRLSKFIRRDPQTHDPNYQFETYDRRKPSPLVLPYIADLKRVCYEIREYETLLDSSNMDMTDWLKIAKDIKKFYKLYDGFVVLHGTDTLAYTSSALSFMLEHLGKPVIITGSQVPILEPVTDGKDNFLCSVAIAGNFHIPEVAVYFNHQLLRGNRISKISTKYFDAFDTCNYPALAKVGTSFDVDYRVVIKPSITSEFNVATKLSDKVCLLKIYPGITADTVKSLFQPPIEGVVIQSFGAGNMPNIEKAGLVNHFKSAVEKGIIIVNVTQCPSGAVSGSYEAGKAFYDIGVVPGFDMTPEAAFTKLCYVLGHDEWSIEEKKKKMSQCLRGELSGVFTPPDEVDLIIAVSNHLQLSSPEQKQHLKNILFPSMVNDAIINGNVTKLSELKSWGTDFNITNTDLRTPLHIACYYGNIDVISFLLSNGANVHSRDRFGNTPLLEAVKHSPRKVIQILLDNGAHLNMEDKDLGIELCKIASKGQVEKLKRFIFARANLNLTDLEERTPLHLACLHGQIDAVRLLLYKGVDKDKIDILGNRPIDYARQTRNEIITSMLMAVKNCDEQSNVNGS